MLDQVNAFFGIAADYDLDLMRQNQTLFDITSKCIAGLESILEKSNPDLVFVQGDTTTVMAGAIASYYRKIPVAHLEAGLRSGDPYSPFPEEINRKIAGQIAKYHFAPTLESANNLRKEGIVSNVYVVGNTVIDALHLGLSLVKQEGVAKMEERFSFLDLVKRIILVTGHRRESFGEGFENICMALKSIAKSHGDVEIVYPVHMNPKVREPVCRILNGIRNVHLIEPLDYPHIIWLMEKSYIVLTDSGGIQEEAPALGKPVLVMREVTERMEGVFAGTAKLVGTNPGSIIEAVDGLLASRNIYESMAKAVNPYGDGKTSERIVKILCEHK